MSVVKARTNRVKVYSSITCALLLVAIFVHRTAPWRLPQQPHVIIETVAATLAIYAAVAAYIRFRSQRHYADLVLSVGWFGVALLDAYYGITTFLLHGVGEFTSTNLSLWLFSRLFLAVFLALYWIVDYGASKYKLGLSRPPYIYLLIAGLLVFFAGVWQIMPNSLTYQSDRLITRPQEFLPALIFGMILVSVWYRHRWVRDGFDQWLILALIINLAAQIFFMPFSHHFLDPLFTFAHILKAVSYLTIIIGFAFDVRRLLRLYRARERQVKRANKTLTREIGERQQLEQRFQGSLIRRERQVQTSTEVAQEIAATAETADLFHKVVDLVQARFGYYHVQVYTLEGAQLLMQEGTGEVGQQLKAQGHYIDVGASRSLVAYAAYNGEALLVKDVSQDPYWLPNKLLPNTASEIAIPIKLQDEVLGVLDVQSDEVNGLDEEDQLLLLGLCGQIAVALNNRRLEEERQQANVALQKYAAELERSNRELQSFAYIASHDLQEPLRMVSNFVQLLQRRYQGQLDERADMYIEHAVDGAKRMRALIDDLLAYSRVGTQGRQFTAVDCNEVLAHALKNLSITIAEQEAIITHDSLPAVWGDRSQLMLVFQNLIANGIKFRGEEAPQIHIGVMAVASDTAEFGESTESPNSADEWHFYVRDNGIGLAEKNVDRIFVIFQRLHSKQEYPGTGIGLAICKKIVERHNGRIWVKSKLGEGATFYFSLPQRNNFDTNT